MIFFFKLSLILSNNSDPKSAIKNIGHHTRLGDIIVLELPFKSLRLHLSRACLFLQFTLRFAGAGSTALK